MTLSLRRSVTATAGLIAAGWLLSACSNASTQEPGATGTGGTQDSEIALETSNQSVVITNNAGKPIEDVRIAIQPFGNAPKGTFLARPTRVGAYPPNKLGLCDMHGNVWQWCADRFNPARGLNRVARGGGWDTEGSDCRAATRTSGATVFRLNDRGFRLARVPVGPQ